MPEMITEKINFPMEKMEDPHHEEKMEEAFEEVGILLDNSESECFKKIISLFKKMIVHVNMHKNPSEYKEETIKFLFSIKPEIQELTETISKLRIHKATSFKRKRLLMEVIVSSLSLRDAIFESYLHFMSCLEKSLDKINIGLSIILLIPVINLCLDLYTEKQEREKENG